MNRSAILLTLLLALRVPAQQPQNGAEALKAFEVPVAKSTDRALAFLLTAEQKDGTFKGPFGKSTGISSLVGLAFLARGHTPVDKDKYGSAVSRRIDYTLKHAKPDGLLESGDHGAGPLYAHNLSTVFLAECRDKVDASRKSKIDAALTRAVAAIVKAQSVKKPEEEQGGWRYSLDSTDSDLPGSVCALLALQSVRRHGVAVPPGAITDGMKYVRRNFRQSRGTFGYRSATAPRQNHDTLTGTGLTIFELCGQHRDPDNLKAGDWILENIPRLPRMEFESWGNCFNAHGMFLLGGTYWENYAAWMYPHYLKAQQENGAWKDPRYEEVYGTVMHVLAFSPPMQKLSFYRLENPGAKKTPSESEKKSAAPSR